MADYNNLLTLQFFKGKDYTNEMFEILSYNKDNSTFLIRYRSTNAKVPHSWSCPRNMLESYIIDFFGVYYSDAVKEADGFLMDCPMLPSINVYLGYDYSVVQKNIGIAIRMIQAFAEHGAPTWKTSYNKESSETPLKK